MQKEAGQTLFAIVAVAILTISIHPQSQAESVFPAEMKQSEKYQVMVQNVRKLKTFFQENLGVILPDQAVLPKAETREAYDQCRGRTWEEYEARYKSDGTKEFTWDGDCKQSDNPYGDVRSFNCFQFGYMQGRILDATKQLVKAFGELGFNNTYKIGESDYPVKGEYTFFDDIHIKFRKHCMEDMQQFNPNLGYSFNELRVHAKEYVAALEKMMEDLGELRSQAALAESLEQ